MIFLRGSADFRGFCNSEKVFSLCFLEIFSALNDVYSLRKMKTIDHNDRSIKEIRQRCGRQRCGQHFQVAMVVSRNRFDEVAAKEIIGSSDCDECIFAPRSQDPR